MRPRGDVKWCMAPGCADWFEFREMETMACRARRFFASPCMEKVFFFRNNDRARSLPTECS